MKRYPIPCESGDKTIPGSTRKHSHTAARSGKFLLLLLSVLAFNMSSYAQGTWTALSNFAPHYNEGVMILLTDGTVLCKTSSGGTYGNAWDKLTPNSAGSYSSGTWSAIDTMHDDRLYFSTQILKDGRLYVAGGEYGTGGYKGEIYDPQANTWTALPPVRPGPYSIKISDANSELLPDGRVLQAVVDTASARLNYIYNPTTNTYSSTGTCLRVNNEASWLKLPDQSILFIDNYGTTSERYIPSTGTWVNDATVPLSLYDAFGFEAGAAFLLPDGRGFFIGATNHTAFYTPSGTTSPGTWSSGPDIPSTQGAPDAAAAMMVNGKILLAVSPVPTSADHFPDPAVFYEFNYLTNTFTAVSAPGGGSTLTGTPTFVTNMLCLPNGQILYATQGSRQYYVYTPGGTPLTAGKPTIDSVIQTSCNTFKVTGKLFNGISEGAGYGDDWQMNTNYPIVRITSGSTVYYARSYNWNRTDVMTGTALDTAQFTIPSAVTTGTYTIQVTANGNASASRTFVVGPSAISPTTASVCSGANVTLTNGSPGGTWASSNTSIATVGSGTGIVHGVAAGTATITYAIGTCTATRVVSVNASPGAFSITGGGLMCSGNAGLSIGLAGSATGVSYQLYNGSTASGSAVSGTGSSISFGLQTVAGTYTVAATNTVSCTSSMTGSATIDVLPLPNSYTVTGGTGVAIGLSGSNSGINYQLYRSTTPVGSPLAGTGSSLSFGIQTVIGTYSVLATNTATTCIRWMTGSAIVSTTVSPITGTASTCAGSTTTLADATSGGSWSSSATSIATVGSASGVVTGIAAGTTTISYTVSGASATVIVTVLANPTVYDFSGGGTICVGGAGAPMILFGSTASIQYQLYLGSTAMGSPVTGTGSNLSFGAQTVAGTYSVLATNPATGCHSAMSGAGVVSTTTSPLPISGTAAVCNTGTTDLTDGITGGTWSSGNTSVATVAAVGFFGEVTGVSPGTAIISYITGGTCNTTKVVTIQPLPTAYSITGGGSMCSGSSGVAIGLANSDAGIVYQPYIGVFSSGSSVSGTGSAISFGTRTVAGTYTVRAVNTTTGCVSYMADSASVSVISNPSAITGSTTICQGSTSTLSDITSGGIWSSSSPAIAYVGSTSGIVTGATIGSTTISYTIGGTCSATVTVTVVPGVSTYTVTGGGTICAGSSGVTVGLSGSEAGVSYQLATSTGVFGSAVSGTGSVLDFGLVNTAGTYSVAATSGASGCTANMAGMATVVVNPLPTAFTVTGGGAYCAGGSGSLVGLGGSSAGISYQLYIDGTSIGTPVAGTGAALSFGSQTVAGTYSVLATNITTGCVNAMSGSVSVSVTSTASAIMGAGSVCAGATITLTDSTSGGTWSSSNTSKASIGTSTGIVTGISAGISTISYTVGGGCSTSVVITVNAAPAAISGASTVGGGSSVTLTDATSGGTWSSSNTSIASVSSTGVVTGGASGSATITYTLPTGCYTTHPITVTVSVTSISGNAPVCVGGTITLSDSASGGVWASNNIAVATVGAATGVVTGVTAGTAIITYTLSGSTTSVVVTVSPLPATIGGATAVCAGQTATVTDATGGGTWGTSSGSVAAIDASTGIVTGLAAGTATLIYTLPTGCSRTATFVVHAVPSAIAGNLGVCVGATSALSDPTSGGVSWASSNSAVASVGSLSGVVTGVSAGTANITYTITYGCYTTAVVTVNTIPSAITGTASTCVGSTTTLSSSSTGGTWNSSNATVASVDASTGVVTGGTTGTATISYTLSGCRTTRVVTVLTTPSVITGTTTVCIGSTTTLSDATTGGTWSSGSTAIATVASSGVVTGISAGTAIITYANSSCYRITTVTVTSGVSSITGATTLCAGSTSALSDASTGGTWSSGTTSVATVSATGVVTGVAAGTAAISYTLSSGCRATAIVTVMAALPSITGATTVNIAATTTFSITTSGGTWSSSNTAVATVDSSTGVVTGVAAGVATITYSLSSGCIKTKSITVNSAVSPISGTLTICAGSTSTLTDATTGGVSWSSSNTAVATVGSLSGVVTGVSAGTAIITYNVVTGAYATAVVTIVAAPAVIAGNTPVCAGSSITLSSDAGGIWTSANTAIATAGSSSGVVTGVAAGAVAISYSLGGCTRTAIVTVNPLPAVITGTATVCNGSTTTLSSTTTGGTWSSTNTSAATVGTSGVVTGVSAGTTIISYTLSTGCTRTTVVTVGAISPITGNLNLCMTLGNTLSNASTGGTWSTSNVIVATITSAGVATGASLGTANITYTLSPGCKTTAMVTVTALPAVITGVFSVCLGNTTTLSSTTAGGTWSTNNAVLGTVDATTGVVSGIAVGTPVISYTLPTGCYRTANVTVKPLPAAITGATSVCVGTTGILTDPTSGGMSWASSNTAVATVGSISGVLTGVSVGTTIITYTLSTGCYTTTVATVNPGGLTAGTITGPASVSLAGSIASPVLYTSSGSTGGTWTTSNTARATIVPSTGYLTGVSAGAVIVTYTVSNTCQTLRATKSITITTPRAAGEEPVNMATGIQLYPNPTTGSFTFEAITEGTLTVYSLEGKQLQQYHVDAGATALNLPKGTAQGVYMCRYSGTDGSSYIVRLVYRP